MHSQSSWSMATGAFSVPSNQVIRKFTHKLFIHLEFEASTTEMMCLEMGQTVITNRCRMFLSTNQLLCRSQLGLNDSQAFPEMEF